MPKKKDKEKMTAKPEKNEAPETHQEQPEADAKPEAPKDELTQLKEEIAAVKDQALRALAEADNTRKRAARDLEDGRKYAVTSFARDLLNVLDNFYRAEEHLPKDISSLDENTKHFVEGISLTKNELLRVFELHGIKRIDPKGEPFDHNLHQAIAQVPNDAVEPNTVIDVVQAGYTLHDRLLRPAMVAVSNKPQS